MTDQRCERCGRVLRVGDTAYVQEDKRINVVGTRVTFVTELVIVCEECA